MATKKIEEIKTHPAFESLFPINDRLLHEIEKDIRSGNYDFSQPIILATWQSQKEEICIDGHTRLQAAKNIGIEEVPIFVHDFDSEDEALEKAIKLQRNRRNMTDAEILTCIETLDKRKQRGGDRRSAAAQSKVQHCPIENEHSSSAQQTGNLLGISERKVKQTRTVMDHADEATKESVKQGDLSINQAYQKTQKKRKQIRAEPPRENAGEKAPREVQDVGQEEDEIEKFTDIAPVFLSLEHFGALRELGGCIEEHVAKAIELYLKSLQNQCAQTSKEEAPEDDDEEYFDPVDYVDSNSR